MIDHKMDQFLNICLALSAERDREKLLSMILDTAMDITNCDAGTLYLLEKDGLHFCRMVTRSLHIRQGGHADPITLPPVPLEPAYICAWAVLKNQVVNVPDVHHDSRFDFSGSARYDAMTGYHTDTMLVVPMANDKGKLIGTMQLINAIDGDGTVVPFSRNVELLVSAVASQTAISLTNMRYAEQITDLLDSLVSALSTAIDRRTPYNANHTRNMVHYGEAFLNWLDRADVSWKFSADDRRAFLMSVWLHDVGKLVVPLEVMDKESRLGSSLERVENRFTMMLLLDKIALLEGRLTEEGCQAAAEEKKAALELIRQVNKAGFLPDDIFVRVQALAGRAYVDAEGQEQPWLTPEELTRLSVRKGTLTAQERSVMESHVVMTSRILENVAFPKEYAAVPLWAGAHHELLNGKGYPKHLSGGDIPREVRLLTILDIFDALTARDRPYKPGMPVERALEILHGMVEEGGIDGEVLSLFEQSKAWEEEI